MQRSPEQEKCLFSIVSSVFEINLSLETTAAYRTKPQTGHPENDRLMWIRCASEVPSDVWSLRCQERAVWAGAGEGYCCAGH